MSKSQLSGVAVALVLAGVAILTGHPAWGAVTGGALILLAGAAAAGAARMRSEGHSEGARGQRVPNNLVTLSAAAIIAVYAAGFNRTRAAADAFAAQAARRRAPAPIAASLEPIKEPSKAARPAAQTPPAVATVTASPVSPVPVAASKKDRAPDSPLRVRSKAPCLPRLRSRSSRHPFRLHRRSHPALPRPILTRRHRPHHPPPLFQLLQPALPVRPSHLRGHRPRPPSPRQRFTIGTEHITAGADPPTEISRHPL